MSIVEKKSLWGLLISTTILIGGVLPFVYDQGLLDFDSVPRFLVLTVFLSCSLLFCWLQRGQIKLPWPPSLYWFEIAFILFVSLRFIGSAQSFDSADAIYTCCRLMVLFFAWLHFRILLDRHPEAPQHLAKGVCMAAIIFSVIGLFDILPALYTALTIDKAYLALAQYGSVFFNKNFFAETLVMSLPFIVVTLSHKSHYAWTIIGAVALACCLFILIMLQSLSALVAIVLGLATFTGFAIKNILNAVKGSRSLRLVLVVVTLVFICTAMFWFNTKFFHNLKHKIESVVTCVQNPQVLVEKKSYNSFTERWLAWKHTTLMIREHAMKGSGTANWKVVIPKYGPYGQGFMDAGTFRFEHPHNEFLFITAEAGLIGLILFVSLFVIALIRFIRKSKNSTTVSQKLQQGVYASGVIAFVTMACFGYPFERFYTALYLMLLFAFATSRYTIPSDLVTDLTSQSLQIHPRRNPIFIVLAIVCVIMTFIFFQRYRGEKMLRAAQHQQSVKDWQKMYAYAHASKSFALKSDLLAAPIDWYAGFAKFYSGDAMSAEPLFESATRQNPYFIQAWNDLGTCYEKRKLYNDAIRCYKNALVVNPYFKNSILNLTAAYYNSGSLDSAYTTIQRHPHTYRALQYRAFLLAVIKAKLKIVSKNNITKNDNLKEENFLIEVYDQSEASGKKIEDVYANMMK